MCSLNHIINTFKALLCKQTKQHKPQQKQKEEEDYEILRPAKDLSVEFLNWTRETSFYQLTSEHPDTSENSSSKTSNKMTISAQLPQQFRTYSEVVQKSTPSVKHEETSGSSRTNLKRRATSPIPCPDTYQNVNRHQDNSIEEERPKDNSIEEEIFDIEAMLQEAMDENQRRDQPVSPAYRITQQPAAPVVTTSQDIDECGARYHGPSQLPRIVSVRSLAHLQPPPPPPMGGGDPCDRWDRCHHCGGAMVHQVHQCPLRMCLKCSAHGHSASECLLTIWDVPYPTTTMLDVPLPFTPTNGGAITAPRWAYLKVSPRILNHLYRINAPTTIGSSQGRPRSFHIAYDGILRAQETTITAIPLHGRLKEIMISSSYPGSRKISGLHVTIPVEGCNGLLNQLHNLEVMQVRPWMDDRKFARHHEIGRSTSTWPSGTGIFDNFTLSTCLGVEHDDGATDRMVEIRISHQSQVLTAESHAVQVPWIQLTQVRARLGCLLDEWRLYTAEEFNTLQDIKAAMYSG